MAANEERRALLTDSGLEVLAEQGARGLTFRAVDREAGVPSGTSSNYFDSRSELLGALADRIFVRLEPDPDVVSELEARPRTASTLEDHMVEIVERTTRNRSLMLALLELRLEAARRPEVAAVLQDSISRAFAADSEYQAGAGLPGAEIEMELLYHGITGLILDTLTVSIGGSMSPEEAARELTRRVMSGFAD